MYRSADFSRISSFRAAPSFLSHPSYLYSFTKKLSRRASDKARTESRRGEIELGVKRPRKLGKILFTFPPRAKTMMIKAESPFRMEEDSCHLLFFSFSFFPSLIFFCHDNQIWLALQVINFANFVIDRHADQYRRPWCNLVSNLWISLKYRVVYLAEHNLRGLLMFFTFNLFAFHFTKFVKFFVSQLIKMLITLCTMIRWQNSSLRTFLQFRDCCFIFSHKRLLIRKTKYIFHNYSNFSIEIQKFRLCCAHDD